MTHSKNPQKLKGIKNITISGRMATGKSTLATHLADILGWDVLDGGKIFREYAKEKGFHIKDKEKIPDKMDRAFEEKTRQILISQKNHIVQSHLAGFVAQGIDGIYKILIVCNDENEEDKQSIRIDRLMNRDLISAEQAKSEIHEREEKLLKKFKRLYATNDTNWVYWNPKYYNLIVNTFNLNQKEAVEYVLKHIRKDV
jgi:cytidylate kinase